MTLRTLHRLAGMDRAELRFRAVSAWRRTRERRRARTAVPRWDREALVRIMTNGGRTAGLLADAQADAARRDWPAAHLALARHFRDRPSAFPLEPSNLDRLTAAIAARFPSAQEHAAHRASTIRAGFYDVLGYTDVPWGTPPDWQLDPVYQRRAPARYWADVAYLDPRNGDHKIIWEINRHQHWLALGRARHLLPDRGAYEEFVAQLDSWLAANPPLTGVNWASMLELAFRTLSWVWALQFFCADGARDDGATWAVDLLVALDAQLQHVENNLSRYFSPNTHLTGEALALYVTGVALPELASSARRAATGRDVLLREAGRQVLKDGVHAERSGHYHRYSTDFYLLALLVARRAQDPAAPRFEAAARAQARALRILCDNAGRRPRIGDDDGGQLFPICGRDAGDCADTLEIAAALLDEPDLAVGPPSEEAWWLCGASMDLPPARSTPSAVPSHVFTDAGYCVSRSHDDVLILDAGPHGYLNGGHAHADALSIVATAGEAPLIVDPGTATYTMDPVTRDRFRSTAMHNTVEVNGHSQSMPGGPFHWTSRADATVRAWRSGEGCDYAEASHGGYAPIVHVRSVVAVHGLGWLVIDRLLGPASADAAAHWHLDPAWAVHAHAPHGVTAHAHGRIAAIVCSRPVEIIGPGHASRLADVSPAYGRTVPSHTVRTFARGALPLSLCTWLVPDASRVLPCTLEAIEVTRPRPGWHVVAFRARLEGAGVAWILSAIERDETAPGAPRTLWGTGDIQTDGRAAFMVATDAGAEAVVVDGARLLHKGVETSAATAEPASIVRTALAPDVHEVAKVRGN